MISTLLVIDSFTQSQVPIVTPNVLLQDRKEELIVGQECIYQLAPEVCVGVLCQYVNTAPDSYKHAGTCLVDRFQFHGTTLMHIVTQPAQGPLGGQP